MKRDIKVLKEYARLRKLPDTIHLGDISDKLKNDLLKLFESTPISNDKAAQNRKGIYGVEHDDTTPLGKTYNQRHITDSIIGVDCLNDFTKKYEWRFADLQPDSSIPKHLDDPSSYRFIIMLKGEHKFTSDDKTIPMKEHEVWFVNSAYHHSVFNDTKNNRIALLGKFEINEHNTRLLRARTGE